MKKLITLIFFSFIIFPLKTNANENFSVEIDALKLVMEKYKQDTKPNIELEVSNKKPIYLAL